MRLAAAMKERERERESETGGGEGVEEAGAQRREFRQVIVPINNAADPPPPVLFPPPPSRSYTKDSLMDTCILSPQGI